MEQRNRVRYRLSAAAVFVWDGPHDGRLHGEGLTRDISVAGAFVFTRTCPPVGAILELEIFLAPRVIRVEHSDGAEGFAAVSKDLTLLFDRKTRNAFGVSSADEEGGDVS
jgi:hypothetical protein